METELHAFFLSINLPNNRWNSMIYPYSHVLSNYFHEEKYFSS